MSAVQIDIELPWPDPDDTVRAGVSAAAAEVIRQLRLGVTARVVVHTGAGRPTVRINDVWCPARPAGLKGSVAAFAEAVYRHAAEFLTAETVGPVWHGAGAGPVPDDFVALAREAARLGVAPHRLAPAAADWPGSPGSRSSGPAEALEAAIEAASQPARILVDPAVAEELAGSSTAELAAGMFTGLGLLIAPPWIVADPRIPPRRFAVMINDLATPPSPLPDPADEWHLGDDVPQDRAKGLIEAAAPVLRRHAKALVRRRVVSLTMDLWHRDGGVEVARFVTAGAGLTALTRVIRRLVSEQVSVRQLPDVVVAAYRAYHRAAADPPLVVEPAGGGLPVSGSAPAFPELGDRVETRMVEAARIALRAAIRHQQEQWYGVIDAVLVDATVERRLLDPAPFTAAERELINAEVASLSAFATPAVVTASAGRARLRRLIEDAHPDVAVVTHAEIGRTARLRQVGRITFSR